MTSHVKLFSAKCHSASFEMDAENFCLLSNYSEDFDESLWDDNGNGIKFSDDFRSVIYKINPNSLACVYKKMFEANSICNLKGVEPDDFDLDEEKRIDKKPSENKENATWATPVKQIKEANVGRSTNSNNKYKGIDNSKYQPYIVKSVTSTSSMPNQEKLIPRKEFRGWDICKRPHSAENSGYLKYTSLENREQMKIRSLSASAKMAARRVKLPMNKVQLNWPLKNPCSNNGNGVGSSPSSSDRTVSDVPSPSGNSTPPALTVPLPYNPSLYNNIVEPIQYKFEHFVHHKDHTRKYREEYTQKRIDTFNNPCASSSTSKACVPVNTQPIFRWSEKGEEKCDAPTVSIEDNLKSEHFRPPIARKISLRKRMSKSTESPPPVYNQVKSPHLMLANNGVLKLEFYDNPMTFDDYEKKSPVVCRTRPTIPSNAHGTIYPSSTDTHSYVIKRRSGYH